MAWLEREGKKAEGRKGGDCTCFQNAKEEEAGEASAPEHDEEGCDDLAGIALA